MNNTKTIKTLTTLKNTLKNSLTTKYDTIVYEPAIGSKMTMISDDIFDYINETNIEEYKKGLPNIILKNVVLIGAMFNNSSLEDWILDKIEFENTNPITFHGIFKYNYKFSTDAMERFFARHRQKDIKIYGTTSEFLNEYVVPTDFNNVVLMYLTLDFFRLKEFPNFEDITYQLLVSPKLTNELSLDDIEQFVKLGLLI